MRLSRTVVDCCVSMIERINKGVLTRNRIIDLEQYKNQVGGPITALRSVVTHQGFVDAAAQKQVAEIFNISLAEVKGIVSFYEDLKTTPPADKTLRICQAEACQARGARLVTEAAEQSLGIAMHQTTPDNRITLEPVYCLGHCATGPAATIDGKLITQLTPETVTDLVSGNPQSEVQEPETNLDGQQRLIFARRGLVAPLDFERYQQDNGFSELPKPEQILEEIKLSGLRGRGGAGFPAHIKWQTVSEQKTDQKYIVCNADEGDSGTFADRMIMEGDPFLLIDGMRIAGRAVGASKGFIYLRSEYPKAADILSDAIEFARSRNALNNEFDIELFIGAGAYICGEETSLLESLEGKRGLVRAKPPLPAISGLLGKPTLVHNVITLCSVPWILQNGGAAYRSIGDGESCGTMPFQLSGNVKQGGLIEIPFGMMLGEFIEKYSGGTQSGRPIKAVQVGGPLGAYLPPKLFNTPLTYEAMTNIGAGIGHGGIIVFDDTVNLLDQARYAFEFCEVESCGKCTPCRLGSVRGGELIDEIAAKGASDERIIVLKDLCDTMTQASLCQMGGMTPIPVMSALTHFPEDFGTEVT